MQWNNLTIEQYNNAPADIQITVVMAMHKIPFSGERIKFLHTTYPQYFDEEMEYRRKWDAIPQSVHDNYEKEYSKLMELFFRHPPNKGMLHWMYHPEEFAAYNKESEKHRESKERMRKRLHEKYYKAYGIKYVPYQW